MDKRRAEKGKSRDPLGLVFELFNPEEAGVDIILSLLSFLNGIKKCHKKLSF